MTRKLNILILTILSLISSLSYGQEKMKLSKGLYAEIETDKGIILLQLAQNEAPLTVANFVGLAEGNLTVFDSISHKKPYYDGIKFHRVISSFMIQGGDPTGTGSGGPGYKFFDEANNGLLHDGPGILSMANAGPATNGSQFFITHLATPHLNGKHTVFGKVLKGQDVVDAIVQGDVMNTVKIIRKGFKYKFRYSPSKVFMNEYQKLESIFQKEQARLAELKILNDARTEVAKSKSIPEYKEYFYTLIKEQNPNAIQTESGLVYVVRQEGSGDKPVKGNGISLHYTGKFVYGDIFDSSVDRGSPLNFEYLVTGLIQGFNEGVGLANAGMKIDLYIPYYLGYGTAGKMPVIPAYSDLIFELEILEIKK